MRPFLPAVTALSSSLLLACPRPPSVQCIENGNCDRFSGGECRAAPSGNHWCSYPDEGCPSGYRYSDLDVGEGLSGQCVTEFSVDAGIDAPPVAVVKNQQPAELVLGQLNFDTSIINNGGASARSLNTPTGMAASENGSIWVFDLGNYRALQWTSLPQADYAAASRVIGHSDFTTVGAESLSARSLTNYEGGISAAAGKLIVADGAHNRILIWNQNPVIDGANADIVMGQPSFTATAPGNLASNLNLPNAVWTDGKRLVASDSGNNRVLIWTTFPTANQRPADIVLGQIDFGRSTSPDPPTASSMNYPHAVCSDGVRLYVADSNNSRVLIWNSFPTSNGQAADLVLGQADFSGRIQGVDVNRLGKPTGLALAGNSLFVVDQSNHRVLAYSPAPTTSSASASYVLGQADFLSNSSGTSQRSFNIPTQVTVQGAKLYVSDSFNSRVLQFALEFQ